MIKETQLISNFIADESRVLDLGCGNGELLATLSDTKRVQGYGIENDEKMIEQCIKYGVNVIEQNLDQGLANFEDSSFDTVVLNHTLQALLHPDLVVKEMLRVGKEGIVTFPNFSYIGNRVYLSLKGRMPVSSVIPYSWYETPNLHHCTFRDFETMCVDMNIRILDCLVLSRHERLINSRWNFLRNLIGSIAIYRISQN